MDNPQIVNHTYSFNNAVPMLDYVMDVCRYLDTCYRELEKMSDEDEKKNEDLKHEYRVYSHKKAFSTRFSIYCYSNVQRSIPTSSSYAELERLRDAGFLKQLSNMTIELNYDFEVGKNNELETHHNEIELKFKPYEITLTRVSDHADAEVDQIEATTKRKMDEFVSYETIFGD